ncbi:hypothetical protein PPL_00996 [Heterostelium album PN500]|uniref:TLC domain-containing protein n=1 Tax=Heterostelium pallidum (strain ATCC 26659 / Pp 5 / PN500) TaxID=670386 RepID=D3AXT9_HETP5|nr:hypothetical protein PPL_00996 [Heterostelium album PN500]EFA85766.1 hypothetical protein PPL_00996 [Heterostelium album PN500]|eukprot:XP_020437872.1 hypothetical protein PPL_00996 [Heterostelium album PN500]
MIISYPKTFLDMELYNHLYENLKACFVEEWPKQPNNITVQLATMYFRNHKSKEMREHIDSIIKSGAFYECCQRFVRAFYGAYFAYHNILNWYYTTSLENSIYHCLAYSLFHVADLVILFLYRSQSYDMYFHHVCVSGFTFITMRYIRKAHYLLHICSSFDLTVVFSTIIFLCRSFGHTLFLLDIECHSPGFWFSTVGDSDMMHCFVQWVHSSLFSWTSSGPEVCSELQRIPGKLCKRQRNFKILYNFYKTTSLTVKINQIKLL